MSSELAAAHNSEAFALSRDKFYSVGVPRTDIFFDEDYKKQTVEKMYEEFPVAKTAKKVILYAPTFRGNGAKTAYFPIHIDVYKRQVYYSDTGEMIYGEQSIDEENYYFDKVTGAMYRGIRELSDGSKIYYGNNGAQGYGEQYVLSLIHIFSFTVVDLL